MGIILNGLGAMLVVVTVTLNTQGQTCLACCTGIVAAGILLLVGANTR